MGKILDADPWIYWLIYGILMVLCGLYVCMCEKSRTSTNQVHPNVPQGEYEEEYQGEYEKYYYEYRKLNIEDNF